MFRSRQRVGIVVALLTLSSYGAQAPMASAAEGRAAGGSRRTVAIATPSNDAASPDPEAPALLPATPSHRIPAPSVTKPATPDGAAATAPANDTATSDTAAPDAKAAPDVASPADEAAQPAPIVLTPEQTALRDRVRRTLTYYFNQPLNTQDNTVTDAIDQCLAYGCYTQIVRNGQKVNGITNLCWNHPCASYVPLMIADGHITPRVGYGLQQRPGQMVAVFALSRVPVDYPVRVGDDVRSVADMVAYEKLTCRSGDDLALKLVGLSFYADKPEWKNGAGEDWSLERMVGEEAEKPIVGALDGGTWRLLGLTMAVERRLRDDQPLDGVFDRARRFIVQFQKYALEQQNADGSWNAEYFARRGPSRDAIGALQASGCIMHWLATSLEDEQLNDPRVVRGIDYVTTALGQQSKQLSLRNMSAADIAAIMNGLRAISVYDDRVFKPADPSAEAAASDDAKASK